MAITDLDMTIEQAHQQAGADPRRSRRITAMVDAHAGVVGNGAFALGEVGEALRRQRAEMGALVLEHGLDLPFGAAMDARCGPLIENLPT